MKRIALLLLASFVVVAQGTAQIKVYASYADLKNDKVLNTYARYGGAGHLVGKPFIEFQSEGSDKWVREKQCWGFTEGEKTCRLDLDAGKYARVVQLVDRGGVCLWVLKGIDQLGEGENQLRDFLLFLSEGMDGELVPMPHGLSSWTGMTIGKYKRFVKDNKDTKYRHLCECLEKERTFKGATTCIGTYNAEHPAKTR